jgi:hypothetical protein
VRAVIPRRNDLPGDRGVLIIAYASHKKKAYSFFLVQSEYGDIYKVNFTGCGAIIGLLEAPGGTWCMLCLSFDLLPSWPAQFLCALKHIV